jgi:hypothetical protein
VPDWFRKEKYMLVRMLPTLCSTAAISLAAFVISVRAADAQGPVYLGSKIPVALWLAGAVLLGIVMAYGIMRNRKRSSAEKQLTEDATRANYAAEERARPAKDIE